MKLSKKQLYILVITFFFGLFISIQGRSFDTVTEIYTRENRSNAFQEIQILNEKNKNLAEEVEKLESTIEQLNDQNLALDVIEKEINKHTKLSGRMPIFGPGISIELKGALSTPWAVDLVNELFNAGAQAVTVNGIRIVNRTVGFDTLPQGQMLLNGSILSTPYTFSAIGEPANMNKILALPGAILQRLKIAYPLLEVTVTSKEIIKVE